MKILIATGLYAPDIGGPATYTAMLEKHLTQQDHEIAVVPFREVRSYPKGIRHIIYWYRVYRAARDVRVVYALDPISVGLPALLAARLRRKTFLLRLGGDYAWEQGRVRFGLQNTLDEYTEEPALAPMRVRVLARLQTLVAKQAALVIAPSEYLKKIIVSWGVADEKVRVVYSSLSPLTPTLDKPTAQKELRATSPVIVTSARLVPWKGVQALINVTQKVIKQYPECTLLIAGDGPEKPALEAYVAKCNLTKQVRFLGRLDKAELANVKQAADVFVLNTAYEGLSHELLEVMDLGVPIVTTIAGGNIELLTNDKEALLVEFNNENELFEAIMTVLTSHQTAGRLVQFARGRSKAFSEAVVIESLLQVLAELHD